MGRWRLPGVLLALCALLLLRGAAAQDDCGPDMFQPAMTDECRPCTTACDPGQFLSGTCTNITSPSCLLCIAGFRCAGGAAGPVLCNAGLFSTVGSSVCSAFTVCSLGTRVGLAPSSTRDRACLVCPAGLTTNVENALACNQPLNEGLLEASVRATLTFSERNLATWTDSDDIALRNAVAQALRLRISQTRITSKFQGSVIINLELRVAANDDAEAAVAALLNNFEATLPASLGAARVSSAEADFSESGSNNDAQVRLVIIIASVVVVAVVLVLVLVVFCLNAKTESRVHADYLEIAKRDRDIEFRLQSAQNSLRPLVNGPQALGTADPRYPTHNGMPAHEEVGPDGMMETRFDNPMYESDSASLVSGVSGSHLPRRSSRVSRGSSFGISSAAASTDGDSHVPDHRRTKRSNDGRPKHTRARAEARAREATLSTASDPGPSLGPIDNVGNTTIAGPDSSFLTTISNQDTEISGAFEFGPHSEVIGGWSGIIEAQSQS